MLRFRKKGFVFLMFLVTYFSINYINLKLTPNVQKHFDSIQNPIEAKIELEMKRQLENTLTENKESSSRNQTRFIIKGLTNRKRSVFNMLVNGETNENEIDCGNSVKIRQRSGFGGADGGLDFEVFLESSPAKGERVNYYYMVYAMESEPHSG